MLVFVANRGAPVGGSKGLVRPRLLRSRGPETKSLDTSNNLENWLMLNIKIVCVNRELNRELKRENLREKELKRGRSEEPCPVGACYRSS